MKYTIDEKTISEHFSEGQITGYMEELGFTRLQALLYLWTFNNFSVHSPDDLKDLGRPMYRKLAKSLSRLFEEENAQ